MRIPAKVVKDMERRKKAFITDGRSRKFIEECVADGQREVTKDPPTFQEICDSAPPPVRKTIENPECIHGIIQYSVICLKCNPEPEHVKQPTPPPAEKGQEYRQFIHTEMYPKFRELADEYNVDLAMGDPLQAMEDAYELGRTEAGSTMPHSMAEIRALRRERDEAREKLAEVQKLADRLRDSPFMQMASQIEAALEAESPRKDAAAEGEAMTAEAAASYAFALLAFACVAFAAYQKGRTDAYTKDYMPQLERFLLMIETMYKRGGGEGSKGT